MKARKLEGGSKSLQVNNRVNPQSYERTSRIQCEDKNSGSYERQTTKEKVSCGDRHVERGSRRAGVRNEYTKSLTTKIGNKRGYTEYYHQERVRDVVFGNNNNYGKNITTNESNDSENYSDDEDSYDNGSDENDSHEDDDSEDNYDNSSDDNSGSEDFDDDDDSSDDNDSDDVYDSDDY